MNPASFSATALSVAEACLARYKAEHIDRSKGFGGTAALLGTSVHGALEMYVKATQLQKVEPPSEKLLLEFFHLSYVQTFGSHDTDTVEYVEGYEMMKSWFARTSFEGVRVVSCEIKDHFDVPTSLGDIPFNYIWDRFDQVGENTFKVVDYKSNRWAIQPSDLKKKIQARSYGLAAAIQLKKEGYVDPKIWVEFDLLRHGRVGTVFTREDNVATWEFICNTAATIIDTPNDKTPETLNAECTFCVRKARCLALKKNVDVGGIHSLSTQELVNARALVDWQRKGLDSLIRELDTQLLTIAKKQDVDALDGTEAIMQIAVSRTRTVDPEMVEMAVGPDLFEKYGSKAITMGSIDKLLKGKELTSEQKANLRSLIYHKTGEPKVKIESKNPIDPI